MSKKRTVKKNGKFVYYFGGGKAEGSGKMKDLLGGKGANLAEMTNSGVPVPAGFTITTESCNYYSKNNKKIPAGLDKQMLDNLKKIEKDMGARFGSKENPLLVSVRSGAKFSMPGMMDTILNLGLNDETLQAMIKQTGNERFAMDSYRRLIQMFGNVVMGIEKHHFEKIIEEKKEALGIKLDTDLDASALKDLISKFKKLVKDKTGQDFPQDPLKQLEMARNAVFESWNNQRAITYRKLNHIPNDLGTAVNVQAMVFGNMGNDSGTGVGFTRNPANGKDEFYGEYLTNAQGEDVVAGVRTPHPIADLKHEMPKVYKQLREITSKLEKHYRDIQDFEFTIQKNKLYMLQTRTGKRTAQAAIKIATDMVKEGSISKEEAIMRIQPEQIDQLLHPVFDPKAKIQVIARGLPASPGAASGKAIFTADEAAALGEKEKVILVRTETCPDDIHGMNAAQGILTARGGMTSHAAVVARGMGKCCIAGCESIRVDEHAKKFSIGNVTVKAGDYISLNGTTGEVILGEVATIEPKLTGEFGEFMKWVDAVRKIGVRANADVPHDAMVARSFGAEGIGLCRTEHMFFAEERLPIVQEMILASDVEKRRPALAKLMPMQKSDFKGLFEEMKGFPVTIRLLDPPLHEFLPKREHLMVEVAEMKLKGASQEKIKEKETLLARVEELHEFNPMLGHRGCRLGIIYPEITEMQAEAIFEAAAELKKEKNMTIIPEVMVPLVGTVNELKAQKELICKKAEEVMARHGVKIKYLVGTMIELPRAAVTADEIAKEAEFFSFGTNDLTQTAFGYSRDDAGKFITYYVDNGILPADPFVTIDQQGVGQLVKMGVEKGRKTKKDLKIGICGEHGGDPASVEFCNKIGLNYVSCSPYRVPIARLAGAQAVLRSKKKTAEYSTK